MTRLWGLILHGCWHRWEAREERNRVWQTDRTLARTSTVNAPAAAGGRRFGCEPVDGREEQAAYVWTLRSKARVGSYAHVVSSAPWQVLHAEEQALATPYSACLCGARQDKPEPVRCWNCGGVMER